MSHLIINSLGQTVICYLLIWLHERSEGLDQLLDDFFVAQADAARGFGGAQVLQEVVGVAGGREVAGALERGGLEDDLDDGLDEVLEAGLPVRLLDGKEVAAVLEAQDFPDDVYGVDEVGVVEFGLPENGPLVVGWVDGVGVG